MIALAIVPAFVAVLCGIDYLEEFVWRKDMERKYGPLKCLRR